MITTERLGLRRWLAQDLEPFVEMNRDPKVMEFLPKQLSRAETEQFLDRIEKHFSTHGYSLYAVDNRISGDFVGFTGFQWATFISDFTPCVEIGWRLPYRHWGKGYASEAAAACLHHGFQVLDFPEIVSFTSVINLRSIAVMKRIHMKFRFRFGHPKLPPEHRLYEHVLYAMKREEYSSAHHIDRCVLNG
ncbi:GNAT family N-acetyltransferase [bacterium]|nr:GNAT family N-acetyltransferase [candidate division CSSED10-310 bacterium]